MAKYFHKKPFLFFVLFWAIFAFLAEICLFNCRSFELLGKNWNSARFTLQKELIEHTEMDGRKAVHFSLSVKDGLPSEIRNIALSLTGVPADKVFEGSVHLDMAADVRGQEKDFTIVPGVEHSGHFAIHPLNPLESLVFTLYDCEPESVSVTINQKVSFNFNSWRFFALWLAGVFIFCFRPNSPIYRHRSDFSSFPQKISYMALLLMQSAFIIFTSVSVYPDFRQAIEAGNTVSGWNYNKRHYQLLTEALEKKSLSLLQKPPEILAELENPYDYWDREQNGAPAYSSYLFDAAYYQGKYYIYYGVIPVLTLLLPYKLLTGEYLFLEFAMMIYAIGATISLTYIYLWFIRRYFPKISWAISWLSCGILLHSTGLIWCVRRAQSYEIAEASAFFFALSGLALNLSALKNNGASCSKWRLFLGCLMMACAIGCRPTSALISLLNVPLFASLIFQKKGRRWKIDFRVLITAAVPYGIVLSILAAYNLRRFGSPLEFGQFYQLTTIDNLAYKQNSNIQEFILGIINFIFGAPPVIKSQYPFIFAPPFLDFGYDGALVKNDIFSVAALCPLVYALLFFLPRGLKEAYARDKRLFFLLLIMSCLPLFMAGTTSSIVGFHQRYIVDFSWMLVLCALIITLFSQSSFEQSDFRAWGNGAFLALFLITATNYLVLSHGESNWFSSVNPLFYQKFVYFFSFWL